MLGLRVAVGGAMLTILMRRVSFDTLFPESADHLTALEVVLGLALMLSSFVLAAWRWQRVVSVLGEHVRLSTLSGFYLAGQFVGNFLPSTIGGDALRVRRLSVHLDKPEVAFASVAIERLTGFIILPMLILVGMLARPSLFSEGNAARLALLTAGIALAVLVVMLILAAHPQVGGRFDETTGWTRFIGAVHLGLERLMADRQRIVDVLVASTVYQLTVVGATYFAAKSLDLDVPLLAVVAFAPAVAAIQVLPISLGGLGVRETAFAVLFAPFGVSNGQALGLGLLVYAMTLVASLAGAPSFATGSRQQSHQREQARQVREA